MFQKTRRDDNDDNGNNLNDDDDGNDDDNGDDDNGNDDDDDDDDGDDWSTFNFSKFTFQSVGSRPIQLTKSSNVGFKFSDKIFPSPENQTGFKDFFLPIPHSYFHVIGWHG